MKYVTTTDLAKRLKIKRDDLFVKLKELNLVFYKDKAYHLTESGEEAGGRLVNKEKYIMITWPEDFNPFNISKAQKTSFLKVKEIAAKLNITAPRVNNILSEIGWIESATKGWKITPSGSEIGGVEKDFRGAKYVIWPTNIFENIVFKRSTSRLHDASEDPIDLIEKSSNDTSNNRKTYKTKDGHIVKSEGEVRIDDILYDSKIRHAYERELPINELYYCDFYIPGEGNRKPIYIEYWGVEKEYSGKNKISYEEYYKQKKHKQEIYERLKLNLINVEPVHKENLYRHLEVELLKYDMALE